VTSALQKASVRLSTAVLFAATACTAQTIPKEIWGQWTVRRELPTKAISCWGEPEAKRLIGSELEYSDKLFRWNTVITDHPIASIRTVTAEQFQSENSSPSVNGSQVSFHQLGIVAKQAEEISIHHESANITGATIEIPGDSVLVKDADTIIFSVCNVYFEAKRLHDKTASREITARKIH